MRQNGYNEKITLSANTNTLQAVFIMEKGYQVDFQAVNSLSCVLGFNKQVYTEHHQESENPVKILNINSIDVNIDIISGSFVDDQRKPMIYSFFPAVSPGFKIIETPTNLAYVPITLDKIYSIQTTITDQDGNLLNLQGEDISIRFHVREV